MADMLFYDVETSGYAKDNARDRSGNYQFQIVSIGMLAVNSSTWKATAEKYIEFKPNPNCSWDPGAERVHGLSQQYLEEHGVEEEEGVASICEFIATHFNLDKAIIAGGHNTSTFDRHFLLNLLDKYQMTLNFSGRAVDTYTLGKTLYNCNDSNELFELVGVARGNHNALEDARLALKAVRTTSKIFKLAVT